MYHYETEQLMIQNMKKLREEKEKLEHENTELRIAKRNLEETVDNLSEEIGEIIEDNDRFKEKNSKLKEEDESLIEVNNQLRSDLDELERGYVAVSDKVTEIKNDIKELNGISTTPAANSIVEFIIYISDSFKQLKKTYLEPDGLFIPNEILNGLERVWNGLKLALDPFAKLNEKLKDIHNALDDVINKSRKISESYVSSGRNKIKTYSRNDKNGRDRV